MKIFTFIILFEILFFNLCFGIDRFVDPTLSLGNGTTRFNTISSAIAASVNGDRILIVAGTYNEPAITIGKSLKLLSQNTGSRVNLNANINISGFPGMKLEIIGFSLGLYSFSFNPIASGVDSNRATVHFIECFATNLNQNKDFYDIKAVLCRFSGNVEMKFGEIILTNALNVYITDESNIVVGDKKISIIGDTIFSELEIRTDNFPVLVANNYLNGLFVIMFDARPTVTNYFRNNDFVNNSNIYFPYHGVPNYNIEFSSNKFVGAAGFINSYCQSGAHYGGNRDCWGFSSTSTFIPNKDVSGFFRWTFNGRVLPNTPSTGGQPLVFSNIQGDTTGSNSGNPQNEYADIDLTINDRGMNGGPYSMLNYRIQSNPSNGRAFIYDLDIPANLFPSQQITIKAKGYHKN